MNIPPPIPLASNLSKLSQKGLLSKKPSAAAILPPEFVAAQLPKATSQSGLPSKHPSARTILPPGSVTSKREGVSQRVTLRPEPFSTTVLPPESSVTKPSKISEKAAAKLPPNKIVSKIKSSKPSPSKSPSSKGSLLTTKKSSSKRSKLTAKDDDFVGGWINGKFYGGGNSGVPPKTGGYVRLTRAQFMVYFDWSILDTLWEEAIRKKLCAPIAGEDPRLQGWWFDYEWCQLYSPKFKLQNVPDYMVSQAENSE